MVWEVEFSMFENLLLARQTTFGLINDRPISSLPSDTAWMGALCDLVRYNNLARTNGEYQKMVTSTMLVDVVSKNFKAALWIWLRSTRITWHLFKQHKLFGVREYQCTGDDYERFVCGRRY